MRLYDRLEPVDDPACQMVANSRRQGFEIAASDLQVMMLRVGRIRRVDADDQHRARLVRTIGRAPMHRERRPSRDVATLRQFLLGPLDLARPQLARRKHAFVAPLELIPFCTGCNLERPMFGMRINRRNIEGERIQPAPSGGRLRYGKVAVPRLVGRPWKGNVEPDFDDPVVGAEHRFAHGDEPGMARDIHEAGHPLRMHLDIEARRTARQGAAGHVLDLVPDRPDVGGDAIGPVGREDALQRDDAGAVQPTHDLRDIISAGHGIETPQPFSRSACQRR